MAVWGRKANTVGSMKILRWSSAVMPLLPVLWLFSGSPFYIFGIQLFGGIVWAGFNLCSLNAVFDIVPGRWRTQAVAYYNVANGVALFAGAFLGGQMMGKLPSIHATPFLTLLLISGLLRAAIYLLMFPHGETSGSTDRSRDIHVMVSRLFFVPARMTCQALGLVTRK